MILFSAILNVRASLTKESFISLVRRWYGAEPDIQDYTDRNIIASRCEKTGGNRTKPAVFDADFIMNFDEMKISVRIESSVYSDSVALAADPALSFIKLLAENGFLENDSDLPASGKPVFVNENNLQLLCEIINGTKRYGLPVVYVSKNENNSDPIDVRLLASKLNGTAHVFVQGRVSLNEQIRQRCDDKNEYFGSVGVYFPDPNIESARFFYQGYNGGFDDFMIEKTVKSIANYFTARKVSSLYTWSGVTDAVLKQLRANALQEKNYADEFVNSASEEISKMKQQIETLSHDNERLIAENEGLKAKIEERDSLPIIFMGNEKDFFPGEIKEIIVSALKEAAKKNRPGSRRHDVLNDVINANDYEHILEDRAIEVKNRLRGYKTMSGTLRRYLEEIGFVITESGKHYRLTYFGDGRYHTTVSKTSSDSRDGNNAALQIIRDML